MTLNPATGVISGVPTVAIAPNIPHHLGVLYIHNSVDLVAVNLK